MLFAQIHKEECPMNCSTRIFLFLLALVLFGGCKQALAIPEGMSTTTDLYPEGARVTFSIPYSEKVSFELPATFDKDSIRPLASDGLTVQSFSVEDLPRPGWIPPVLAELKASIDSKKKEKSLLEAKTAAITQSFNLLSGPLPKDLKGPEITAYIETARELREKLGTEMVSLNEEIRKTDESLSILMDEYDSRMPENADRVLSISATLSGKGNFLVEGWTSQAGWAPSYRMDLESATGKIDGKLRAAAMQKTGISLSGTLIFHTTIPSLSVSPPKLTPQIVDYEEELDKSMRPAMLGRSAVMLSEESSQAAPYAPPAIVRTLTDMSVRVEGKTEGDGTVAEFTLGTFGMQSEVAIVAVPLLSKQAWVTAEVKELPISLLPAPADLFVDGNASGKTVLKEQGEGTAFTAAFGKMPLVTAVREKIVKKEGSSWIGKGRLEEGYTIDVTNGTPSKVTLQLKDRIPLSAQEKITVETVTVDPKPAEQTNQNILTWKIDLNPGAKKTVRVVYRLGYPSDKEIIIQ